MCSFLVFFRFVAVNDVTFPHRLLDLYDFWHLGQLFIIASHFPLLGGSLLPTTRHCDSSWFWILTAPRPFQINSSYLVLIFTHRTYFKSFGASVSIDVWNCYLFNLQFELSHTSNLNPPHIPFLFTPCFALVFNVFDLSTHISHIIIDTLVMVVSPRPESWSENVRWPVHRCTCHLKQKWVAPWAHRYFEFPPCKPHQSIFAITTSSDRWRSSRMHCLFCCK